MRRMASPSALSRTLSLQRANARAARSNARAESFSDEQSPISQRIDLLFTSIPACSNSCLASPTAIDADQSTPLDEPSKQLHNVLQAVDGGHLHSAMKRCFSADIPRVDKACFASWSERLERGVDLWDRDFSSMSSYASDHDGFLCGLRARLNSDSSALCGSAKGSKEDACSKSSCSEDSLVDAIQREDGETSIACRLEGLGIGCASESPSRFTYQNAQHGVGSSLRLLEKHNMLTPENCARDERAKIDCEPRSTGGLEEYLLRRVGYLAQCQQVGASGTHRSHDASARDGDEETRAAMAEGVHWGTTIGGSSIPEEGGEGEVIASREKDDRLRVRCKGDYEKLEKEIMMGSERGEEEESRGVKGLRRLPADSVAVEMVSVNVVEDFRESMYEMMLEKNMEEECEDSSMQDLLNCYLLLNSSQLHNIIREVFSDVWIDIIMSLR